MGSDKKFSISYKICISCDERRHISVYRTKSSRVCNFCKPPGSKSLKITKRDTFLNLRYGISLREYNQILIEQDHCCKICNLHMTSFTKSLSVDHDHKTGIVRGLLCQNCNSGLGFFKDNIDYLINALNYIKKSKKESKSD